MSKTKTQKKKLSKSKHTVRYGDDHAENYQYLMDLEQLGLAQTDQEAQQRVDILVNASNEDFAPASTRLGQWHLIGHYLPQNIDSAILFFQHAAKLGDALAMVELAHLGLKSLSPNLSVEQGLEYLKQAVDLNHPEAIYASALHIIENNPSAAFNLLIHNYQQNKHELSLKICVENAQFDPALVIQKLEEFADTDHFACALLAFQYFKQNNDKKAFKYAQKAQEQNDPYGCYVRALMERKNPNADPKIVQEFMLKAAQFGHIEASYWAAVENLRCADHIEDQSEQQQLTQQAFQLLKYAASYGYVAAQYSFGQCLKYGIGTEKNPEYAQQCLEKAAEQGNADAQFAIAMDLPLEHPRYLALMTAAAKNGHIQAMLCIALYEQQQQQFVQAIQWLDLAQQANSARASYLLAQMYRIGQGVEIDLKYVVELLKQAAEGGDIDAYFELYEAYSKGLGVRKNKKNAEKYLNLAQLNQHAEACMIAL